MIASYNRPFGPIIPSSPMVGNSTTTPHSTAFNTAPFYKKEVIYRPLRGLYTTSSHIEEGRIIAAKGRNSTAFSYIKTIKTILKLIDLIARIKAAHTSPLTLVSTKNRHQSIEKSIKNKQQEER